MLFSLENIVLGITLGLAAKLGITFIFFIAILYLDKEKKKMFFKFYLALSPFIIASAVPALLDRDYSSFWEITSSLLSSNMIFGYLIFSSRPEEITEMIKNIGLPYSLTELALLIYRYISLLGKFYRDVNRYLHARLAYRGLKSPYGAIANGVVTVFLKTISQSNKTAVCLRARGFSGKLFFSTAFYPLRRAFWLTSVFWGISLIFMEVFL